MGKATGRDIYMYVIRVALLMVDDFIEGFMSVTQLFFLSSRSCWEVYIFFGFRAIKACCPVVSRFILVRLAARVVWPTVITALFRATICYCLVVYNVYLL